MKRKNVLVYFLFPLFFTSSCSITDNTLSEDTKLVHRLNKRLKKSNIEQVALFLSKNFIIDDASSVSYNNQLEHISSNEDLLYLIPQILYQNLQGDWDIKINNESMYFPTIMISNISSDFLMKLTVNQQNHKWKIISIDFKNTKADKNDLDIVQE